jgi:GTP diphosphokinase / guanosine-3',5'-bis(diphosphate) 3'-diphosphatase
MMSYLPPPIPFVVHPIATPDLAYEELISIASRYLSALDLPKLAAAYTVALHSHAGQLRKSGEAYIIHPLQVASFAAQMKLDVDALVAAILHDCVEDSHLTLEAVAEQFGDTVAMLVDGLTKIEHLKLASREEQQAENFRKMLLAMSRDLRVMLIKLCDRSHNMRTLASLDTPRRKRIAQETMDIFAPVAHRLGLNPLYRELQELSFAYLKPMRYRVLANAVHDPRRQRSDQVEHTRKKLSDALKATGIPAQVHGRDKALYSIYRKMERKRLPFAKVSDVFGLRVVVDTEPECYLALGAIHKIFKPQPGRIKDFIALPKPNGYQSLHTTLYSEHGAPFEVQICSLSMHRVADSGVAVHWLYRHQTLHQGALHSSADAPENAMSWVRELLELDAGGGAREFLEHVKADLFPDHVYVFTPQGKIIALPKGATALDFAYAIHSDIGNRCLAVDINELRVSLRTVLRTGDKVSVHTSSAAQPRPDWLQFAKTAKARAAVRSYMRGLTEEAVQNFGEKILIRALSSLGIVYNDLTCEHWKRALHVLHVTLPNPPAHMIHTALTSLPPHKLQLFTEVGLGTRPALLVAQAIAQATNIAKLTDVANIKRVAIAGTQGVGALYAPCCLPIPGDAVVGRLSSDGRLNVHTHDCKVMSKSRDKDPDTWLDLSWGDTAGETFYSHILVDVCNGKGVLAQVAAAITDAGCYIGQVRTDDEPGETATMSFHIAVSDRVHLAMVYRSLRRVPYTVGIRRNGHE